MNPCYQTSHILPEGGNGGGVIYTLQIRAHINPIDQFQQPPPPSFSPCHNFFVSSTPDLIPLGSCTHHGTLDGGYWLVVKWDRNKKLMILPLGIRVRVVMNNFTLVQSLPFSQYIPILLFLYPRVPRPTPLDS